MLTATGSDIVPFTTHSPESNPIVLVFNVMAQRLTSACNESNVRTNNYMISLLNQIIDSISPDIVFFMLPKMWSQQFFVMV